MEPGRLLLFGLFGVTTGSRIARVCEHYELRDVVGAVGCVGDHNSRLPVFIGNHSYGGGYDTCDRERAAGGVSGGRHHWGRGRVFPLANSQTGARQH